MCLTASSAMCVRGRLRWRRRRRRPSAVDSDDDGEGEGDDDDDDDADDNANARPPPQSWDDDFEDARDSLQKAAPSPSSALALAGGLLQPLAISASASLSASESANSNWRHHNYWRTALRQNGLLRAGSCSHIWFRSRSRHACRGVWHLELDWAGRGRGGVFLAP